MYAVRGTVVVGAKCRWIVQVFPGARLVMQLLAKTNEAGLGPPTAISTIEIAAAPVLVTVTICDALDAPTSTEPNATLLRVKESIGG